jgi:hypothetical protein
VFIEVKTRTSEAFGRLRRRHRAKAGASRCGGLPRPVVEDRVDDAVEVVPVGARWRVTHILDAFRLGD